MAHWQVFWQGYPDYKASHWHELGGVITYASRMIKHWEGRRHGDLVAALARGERVCRLSDGKPRYVSLLDGHCVPPTKKYHRQLLANVERLVCLLDSTKHDRSKRFPT